jgi:hypothetical protein
MNNSIITSEGTWFNSAMIRCRVRITLGYTEYGKKHFDVWFEDKYQSMTVYAGTYTSEYEAMQMIEKITGQKVQWRLAA